jgi:hypothetical protein
MTNFTEYLGTISTTFHSHWLKQSMLSLTALEQYSTGASSICLWSSSAMEIQYL